MKFYSGFYYPDDEQHMIDWCEKHGVQMFGRTAYQGKKQLATVDLCTKLGRLAVAIDVGAHIGHWSVTLAKHFGQVIAFEPVPAHIECFVQNMDPNVKNVELMRCALGDMAGTVSMQVEKGNSGNSSVRPASNKDPASTVQMLTLDSYQFRHVDLIKIDTEGFEVQVLKGAVGTIAQWRPVIIVEQKRDMGAKYGNKPLQAVELLKTWGYFVVADLGGDFLCMHSESKVRA